MIAAQTGTIQAGYVAESGATLVEYATPDETVAAVVNGEVGRGSGRCQSFIQTLRVACQFRPDAGRRSGRARRRCRHGACARSDGELKAKFDAAIQSMKDDGSLNTLIDKVGSRRASGKLTRRPGRPNASLRTKLGTVPTSCLLMDCTLIAPTRRR